MNAREQRIDAAPGELTPTESCAMYACFGAALVLILVAWVWSVTA